MSEPRKEFVEFLDKMEEAFEMDEESGHVEGDNLLRGLIDKLLRGYVAYGEDLQWDTKKSEANYMTYAESRLVRKALALYDGMPKWYA